MMGCKMFTAAICGQFLTPLFALFIFASTGSAQVVINEVLFRTDPGNADPLKTQQWIELYNRGASAVDLTGWKISGRDGVSGAAARALPSTSLAAGGYLVLHLTTGTNSGSDYYTQDAAGIWNPDMDEVGLYSPQGIVDFIAWYDAKASYAAGAAANDAVAAHIWTTGAALNSDGIQVLSFERPRRVEAGMSIGRDPASTDTDATADFEPHGGVGALGNSPGRQNSDAIRIVQADPPVAPASVGAAGAAKPEAAPANKKWTVMLYFNGDNSLEYYMYGNIQEVAFGGSPLFNLKSLGQGGSDANVNYVLMYNGQRFSTGTYRGLIRGDGAPGTLTLERALGQNVQLPAKLDMGDPATLANFIAFAKANYPADNYALILSAHGDGWKGWGPDESFKSATNDGDYLYMGEVSKGLAGQHFALIGFDACMMAGIEVADQLHSFTDYLVASEEVIPGYGFPYSAFTVALKQNPAWGGVDLGRNIVSNYSARYQNFSGWTLSLINEGLLFPLISEVDGWSGLLKTGVGLFQQRDNPWDNVQILLKVARLQTLSFRDQNFVDLYDLAQQIGTAGNGIPDCVTIPIKQIQQNIVNNVVVAQVHSTDLPNAHGLHIYFPTNRKQSPESFTDYDLPYTRATDASSPYAIYAQNHDQLPLKARDRETQAPLNPRIDWPQPPSPALAFTADTHWSQFLERYYHPVADNHITHAISPFGAVIYPSSSGGGACSNPSDSITVPLYSTVYFSGLGSSDADQNDIRITDAAGIVYSAPNFLTPSFYFWDLDSTKGCLKNCTLQPHTVPAGTPADQAVTNMDADQDINNTTFDQNDAQGPTTTKFCLTEGTFNVTLMTWDDNHLKAFHNTLPDANYVHPQSNSYEATVTCVGSIEEYYNRPLPYPSSAILQLNFTVASDPYVSAAYVGLVTGTATATFSGLGVNPTSNARRLSPDAAKPEATTPAISITGNVPQLVPASGSFDPTTNSFDITGVSTGLIAGFPNVQAEYALTLSGAGLTTVTGTYKVGLNRTLNNEPAPVTYNVTGTITNKIYPPITTPLIVTVNTAGGGPVIAQNDWIEIHGANLVPATTPAAGVIWSSAPEFAAGRMPTQLSGVSVTVNGKPAFVYFYCSLATSKTCTSDQVNVLTPLDSTVGPVQIVVTSGSVSSPPFTVTMQAAAPSFLLLNPQGYVVATHSNYALAGPTSLYPGYTTPAKAGETIILYGVGFGLPSTPLANGSSTQSGVLATPPVCTMGNLPAPVVFAGLVGPGLYQFNLTVPAGAVTGEVNCTYGGKSTPSGDVIAVQP